MKNNEERMMGRVVEVQRDYYTIVSENGEIPAKVKGTFYMEEREFPVIGDYVWFWYNKDGESLIDEICERKSIFARPNQLGHADGYAKTVKEQILAANFDYVFITASLNQNFNLNRIARYISVTLQGKGKPVVILTKLDLCDNSETYISKVHELSNQVDVLALSSVTGEGLEQLDPYMKSGNTIVLLGSSGVGKSTLLNRLAGENWMKVSAIREQDARGRHTTTHRQLFTLPSGVIIMDTPGIRELGLYDAGEGLEDTFEDITEQINCCKFRDCTHTTEPGCAIQRALEDGSLSEERWKLYRHLMDENQRVKGKIAIDQSKSAKRRQLEMMTKKMNNSKNGKNGWKRTQVALDKRRNEYD